MTAPEAEARHLPVRGRGGEHGGGLRQAHRPPGRRLRHPRTRRLPRRHRRARGHAGQHAAAAVRRPDPAARIPGATPSRKSTTGRCSRRWRNGSPRSTTPRASPKWSPTPSMSATSGRPGPVVIALSEEMQTRPDRGARYVPRAPVSAAMPDPAALRRDEAHAGDSHAGRWPSLGGSGWTDAGPGRDRRLRRRAQPAGHGRVPPPGAVRRHAGEFRRRSRRRLRSRPARQGEGRRPDPGDRRAPRRCRHPGLHVVRAAGRRADRPGPSRRGGDRAGLSPGARHRLRPQRLRRRRRRPAPVHGLGLGRLDRGAAPAARGRAGGAGVRGPAQSRHGDARVGRAAGPGRRRHHRCRQFRHLGAALRQFQRRPALHRPDQRGDGLRACRPRSAPRSPSPTGWWWRLSATAAS